MSIRTIEYTVNAQGISPADVQSAGLQGEDKATDLVFCLSQTFYDALVAEYPSTQLRFRVDTQDGAGGFHASEHLQVDSELQVVYSLPKEITLQGGVSRSFLVISALEESNSVERVVYSFPALLHFAATPQGSAAQTVYQKDLTGLAAEVAEERVLAAQYADDARYAAENAKTSAEAASQMLNEVNDLDVPTLARQTKTYASQAAGNKDLAEEYAQQAQKQALAAQGSFNGAADFAGQAAASLRGVKTLVQEFATRVKGQKKARSLRIENAEQNPLDRTITVQVESKNILDYRKFPQSGVSPLYGIAYTNSQNGEIRFSGTATSDYAIYLLEGEADNPFKSGKTYFVSKLSGAPSGVLFYLRYKDEFGMIRAVGNGSILWKEGYTFLNCYVYIPKGTVIDTTVFPQIEEGFVSTEFSPYVEDVTQVPIYFYDDNANDVFVVLYANESGVIEAVQAAQPETNIVPYNDKHQTSVTVTATYSQSIQYAIDELRQAMISLGGNV